MNFILIFYKSEFTTCQRIKGLPTERRAKLIPTLFSKTIKSINKFHPNSWIHVLTDESHKDRDNIIFYKRKIDKNYKCKLNIFSLLSEPAMFMDLDILITRPFANKHMNPNCDFNLFHPYEKDLNLFSNFPIKTKTAYNSGIVWINRPNKSITKELQFYQEKFFSDLEKIKKANGYINNDEYPISLFIDKHNLNMETSPEVNVPRHLINSIHEIENYQSIHYNNENNKYLLIQEWQYYNNKYLLL